MLHLNFVYSLQGLNDLRKDVKEQKRNYTVKGIWSIMLSQMTNILNVVHTLLFLINLQIR